MDSVTGSKDLQSYSLIYDFCLLVALMSKVYQSMTEGRELDLKLLTFYGVVTTPLNRWSLAFVTLQIQPISKSWQQSMIRIR